jgi:hypothetical protein
MHFLFNKIYSNFIPAIKKILNFHMFKEYMSFLYTGRVGGSFLV